MSDTSFDNTPPDISNAANAAKDISNQLLPEKSRKKYEKAYQDFINWKLSKNYNTSFSEDELLVYFQELSQKFKYSSLWTIYSMLKSTLSINHNVDISKYSKLIALIKRKAEGYTGKKSKTLLPNEINKFLSKAPDQVYLSVKVALIFGTMGACSRQELYALLYNDVQINEALIEVNINNKKTKINRRFTITGKYLKICKKYIALRPNPCRNPCFFLQYRSGKCTSQRIGINTFSNLAKTIANYLQLPNPELYTGHCFRRTSATLLVDAGGDITSLKRHGGWKSTSVAKGYINDSIASKIQVSNQISNLIENKNNEVVNVNIPSTSGSANIQQCANNSSAFQ